MFIDFERNTEIKSSEKRKIPKILDYLRQTPGVFTSLGSIVFTALVLEVCTLVAPLYLQFAIDKIQSEEYFDILTTITIGFFFLALTQALLNVVRSTLVVMLTQYIALQWPVKIFSHMMSLPMTFFYRHPLGDITSRFDSLNAIQQKITVGATEAFLDGIMAAASFFVLLAYSPNLTILPVSALLIQFAIRLLAFKKLEALSKDRLVASARENSYFLESIRAILPLKLFSRELDRRTGWQSLMTDVQRLDIKKGRLEAIVAGLVGLVTTLEAIAVIYFGIRLVFSGANGEVFSLGMLIVFITYKMQFIARINGVLAFLFDFKMIKLHTDRLAEIVMVESEPTGKTMDLSDLPATIELRNLSFQYESNGSSIINNACCKFYAGERIAITGKSGEGKTSLLKLLLGLLKPTAGDILYGGVSLNELGDNNVRPLIGTVMQDDALLVGTIRQNICFFDRHASEDEIVSCAKLSGMHDEILRMPMGYLTKIGDLGDGLSGGQKQRLLLARALFKKPKFLLLDEATSHLDTTNEILVNEAIKSLAITRIIVAHRHSTIVSADRIFSLASGNLEEVSDRSTLDSALHETKPK